MKVVNHPVAVRFVGIATVFVLFYGELSGCRPVETSPVASKALAPVQQKSAAVDNIAPSGPLELITPPPPRAVAPFDANQARAHQAAWAAHLRTTVETRNSLGARLILIPPGEFLMGSTDEQVESAARVVGDEGGRDWTRASILKAERPQRRVVISQPFWMGATEVTIGEFKQFSAATGYRTAAETDEINVRNAPAPPTGRVTITTYLQPGHPVTDDSPASLITWNDAVAFCQWLSTREQGGYRLPTEREWEYACRAGTTTQYSFGDDHAEFGEYGWNNKNSEGQSHPVGQKLPNNFGLFDMHGNLYECCQDFLDEAWYAKATPADERGPAAGVLMMMRSGSWLSFASNSRSAYRGNGADKTYRCNYHGFRYVREHGPLRAP